MYKSCLSPDVVRGASQWDVPGEKRKRELVRKKYGMDAFLYLIIYKACQKDCFLSYKC